MARAPLQILVLPYRHLALERSAQFEYAVFARADYLYWQFIAGGQKIKSHRWKRQDVRHLRKLELSRDVHKLLGKGPRG